MENINDIATTTSYNGKTLLDGTHAKKYVTVTPASSTDTTPTNTTEETEETLEPESLSASDYTITKDGEDGVYILADGYTGTVTINTQNVKFTQATPSTTLNNVSIVESAGGNANLWIEDLNIKSYSSNENIISFRARTTV